LETKYSSQSTAQVTLDDQAQRKVVEFILDVDKKGRKAREPYENGEQGWKECEKAYHCKPFAELAEEMQWQSNHVLPWAYDAVESWYAYLHSAMLPSIDKIFAIEPRTPEDKPGCETMEKYMEYRFGKNKTPALMGKALKQAAIRNHTCVKPMWRDDRRIAYEWQDEPVMQTITHPETLQPVQIPTGQVNKVRKPVETQVYNNFWADVIDIDNISFFPIDGDFDKTNLVHTTSMYLEELEEQVKQGKADYFNLDQVRDMCRKDDDNPDPEKAENGATAQTGLKIKEGWINRIKIDGKVYNNYVGVVVNDKILIQFKPNGNDYGKKPFIWLCMNPDGNKLYGYGLLSKGLPILKSATFIFNQRLNEIKLKLYGSYKYYDDGVFNPYNVVSQPGAMIPVADATSAAQNLMPLNPNLQHIQLAYTEVAEQKAEFEEVTVPKVVKGLVEQKDTTATEISNVQNNSSGKMNVQAYHINDNLFQPWLEWQYLLTYQRMQFPDNKLKLEIARVTIPATKLIPPIDINGNPIQGPPLERQKEPKELIDELPQFIPAPDIDIKMVAYQNTIRKQEQLQALGAIVPQLIQSPAAPYLKWYEIAEQSFTSAELDPKRFLCSPEEKDQIDQAQQQNPAADAAMQIEQMKLQIQQMAEQNKAQQQQSSVMQQQMANDLKAMELNLKYSLEGAKLEHDKEQAHNDLMVQDAQLQHQQYNSDADREASQQQHSESLKAKANEPKPSK
jgi:hypothetical protein